MGDIGEDYRLDEVALLAVAVTTQGNSGTLLLAAIDTIHNAVKLELRYLGSLECSLLKGIAEFVPGRTLLESGDELVIDAFLDQQAGSSTAALTMIKEDTEVGPGDGAVNFGVAEDEIRRFPAQLKSHLL